jgi:SAM-dependent methyltransferase
MYDVAGRERKARTMLAVLADHFGDSLGRLSVLTVGSSTGIIDSVLAEQVRRVTAIDIDAHAIEHAARNYRRDNLSFQVGDALALDFPDGSFDVVVCAQVYEHVPDAERMMREIFRVLRTGGACYFAASNRLRWREPHYDLPLLSVLPRALADPYLRAMRGIPSYYERHYTYWGLLRLVRHFRLCDYTVKIVQDPQKYAADYMIAPHTLKARLARFVLKFLYWMSPGYVWLLVKE